MAQVIAIPYTLTFSKIMEILDVVASLVNLKNKYHNIHDELVTISTDLSGEKRIYKAL